MSQIKRGVALHIASALCSNLLKVKYQHLQTINKQIGESLRRLVYDHNVDTNLREALSAVNTQLLKINMRTGINAKSAAFPMTNHFLITGEPLYHLRDVWTVDGNTLTPILMDAFGFNPTQFNCEPFICIEQFTNVSFTKLDFKNVHPMVRSQIEAYLPQLDAALAQVTKLYKVTLAACLSCDTMMDLRTKYPVLYKIQREWRVHPVNTPYVSNLTLPQLATLQLSMQTSLPV